MRKPDEAQVRRGTAILCEELPELRRRHVLGDALYFEYVTRRILRRRSLRQYAADRRWPMSVRVLLARPGQYGLARAIWGWPRRHALGVAAAPVFGRAYLRSVPAWKHWTHLAETLDGGRG